MIVTSPLPRLFTIGELSRLWRIPVWRLQRFLDRRLTVVPRVGAYRVIAEIDLPALRVALEEAGHLSPEPVAK